MKLIIFLTLYISHTPPLEPIYKPVFRAPPNLVIIPPVVNIPGLVPAPAKQNPILFHNLLPIINWIK